MYKKYFLLFVIFITANLAGAQTPALRGVAKAGARRGIGSGFPRQAVKIQAARFAQTGLRKGGLSYIERDAQIGKEIMAGSSMVGKPPYQTYHKVKDHTGFLGEHISAALARKLAKTAQNFSQFPAYYKSFSQAKTQCKKPLGMYEGILEAAYGEEALFDGAFVRTFDEALAFTQQAVKDGLSAQEAMAKATEQAEEIKSGFFVIRVAGNERRPKDVLLLDLANNRFISVNQSKARVWAQIVRRRGKTEPFFGRVAYLTRYDMAQVPMKDVIYMPVGRDEQGQSVSDELFAVVLDKGNEVWINMHDGLNGTVWHGFSILEKEELAAIQVKANILEALEKGYYIFQRDGTSPVLFSSQLGKPLFRTVGEVDEYVAAQKND